MNLFIFDKYLLLILVVSSSFPVSDGLGLFCSGLLSFVSALFPVFEFWFFLSELPDGSELFSLSFLLAEVGTFGVLTGSIGEFVRERLPKNLIGFSGLDLLF